MGVIEVSPPEGIAPVYGLEPVVELEPPIKTPMQIASELLLKLVRKTEKKED